MLGELLSLLTLLVRPLLVVLLLVVVVRLSGRGLPEPLVPTWLTLLVFLGLWVLSTFVHAAVTTRTPNPLLVGLDVVLNAPLEIALWFRPARPTDVITFTEIVGALGTFVAGVVYLYLLSVLLGHGVRAVWADIGWRETDV